MQLANVIPDLFDSFDPGENLKLKAEWFRTSKPVANCVKIVSPGRLHFSLFDYLYMNPPLPGGGGIGISTDVFQNHVEISIGGRRSAGSPIPPAVRHIRLLFGKLVDYPGDELEISVQTRIPHAHQGYGSNVTLNTAVFWGLNLLFGSPFGREEAFEILTRNYIESTDDRKVHWGFDTGVGEASLLFGGFVLNDEACRFMGCIPVPEIFSVVARGRMENLALDDYKARGLLEQGETGAVEAKINEEVGMVHQKRYGAALKAFLREGLVPAFRSGSYEALCRQIWRLNELGTFKRMQLSYREDVMLAFEEAAKACGAVYCGISSAGPSMFALVSDLVRAEGFKDRIEREFSGFFESVAVGRAGNPLQTSLEPS
jgi:predicted sugar kinase